MTKTELIDIVTIIVMSYPERYKADDIPAIVTAWYAFFKDDDATAVSLAVTKHVACNKWPPTIAEIRSAMVDVLHPELIPPDVAWTAVADVMHSVDQWGWGRPTFPPLIERVVETIGWGHLKEMSRGSYAGQKDGFDRVAFMELYKPAYERARQEATLPASLSAAISKVRQLSPEADTFLLQAENMRREEDEKFRRIIHRSYAKQIDSPTEKALLEDKK